MNKRLIFSLLCVLILFGVFEVIFVFSEASSITLEGAVTINDTGKHNLNLSCRPVGALNGTNLSLWHNLVSNQSLGAINQTNFTIMVNTTHNNTVHEFTLATGFGGSLNEGNYSWTCRMENATGATWNVSTVNYSITIDRTLPTIELRTLNITDGTNTIYSLDGDLNGTTGFLKNGSDANVYFAIADASSGIANVTLCATWGNKTGIFNTLEACNRTANFIVGKTGTYGGVYNATIPTTAVADGNVVSFAILVNDSAGNHKLFNNSELFYNFTMDTTAPYKRGISLSATKIESRKSITATCTASEEHSSLNYIITLTKPSGKQVVKDATSGKATFKDVETGEVGTNTIQCKVVNSVGLSRTVSQTFNVYHGEDAAALVVEEAEEKVADVDISKAVVGEKAEGTLAGKQGESKTFSLDGVTSHSLTFLEVGTDEVTLRFESDPIDVKLKVNEIKELDLDGDGLNDVKVTLVSIVDGKVNVKVENLGKVKQITEEGEEVIEKAPETVEEVASKWGVWVVILVILVILVVGYLLIKGKKGKKGEIKFTKKDLISKEGFNY